MRDLNDLLNECREIATKHKLYLLVDFDNSDVIVAEFIDVFYDEYSSNTQYETMYAGEGETIEEALIQLIVDYKQRFPGTTHEK